MGTDGTLGVETCFVASLELKAAEKLVCLGAVYDEAGLTEVRKGSRVVVRRWLSQSTFSPKDDLHYSSIRNAAIHYIIQSNRGNDLLWKMKVYPYLDMDMDMDMDMCYYWLRL